MKTHLLFTTILALIILSSLHLSAQVGINTDGSPPAGSAMLDVKSANKGLLIPRIALTGTLDVTTIASPATSLLIYNTATAGTSPNNVTPGYYYWSGTSWTRLSVFAGGSGTTNYIPKWSSTGTLTNSLLFDDGYDIGIGTATPSAKLDVAGRIMQSNTGQSVFIGEGTGANDDLNNRQNIFIGYLAGNSNTTGNLNAANGAFALSSNTTGQNNVATGAYTLNANLQGNNNTATGVSSLRFNNYGGNNTANGVNVLMQNLTGNNNTATGAYALTSNTSGEYNSAFGGIALSSNNGGKNNTANGYNALHANTTGYNNTANGINVLSSNLTGYNNTANGDSALSSNTTGSNNVSLGYRADVASGNLANATAIGANAIVGQSNSMVLGGTGDYAVNVGIGTTTPSAKLDIVGAIKITDGTQGANKILLSDANGLASWQTPSSMFSPWLLTGNSSTVPGTNFIGTIDNNALEFRTYNVVRTRITTKGAIETYSTGQSVFIGEGAGCLDSRRVTKRLLCSPHS